MQKHIGQLSIAGFFGLFVAANAQAAPFATAGAPLDGT
jgi:hypothetical protein